MDMFTTATLVLFAIGGTAAQVVLEPRNATVLQNSDARFNCSTRQSGWTIMIWSLNGVLTLNILESSGVVNSGSLKGFSALNYSTAGESKWEFIIENVLRNNSGVVSCQIQFSEAVTAELSVQESGSVEIPGANRTAEEGDQVVFQCLAANWFPAPQISWALDGTLVDQQFYNTSSVNMGTLFNANSTFWFTASRNISVACLASIPALAVPQRSSIFLVVEKAAQPARRDQTVLIAVTVSVSAAVLLVLIIIAIVFCCKRRKKAKSRSQEEARARSQSQSKEAAHTGEGQGQDNLAYVTDPKASDTNSEYTDSGFWQPNPISTITLPEGVTSSQQANGAAYPHLTLTDTGVRKHRHVTIV